MKITRYRKEDDITYALGATVVMEYLLHDTENVKGIIIHPDFRAEDTKERITSICTENKIPMVTEEKPFNILSQKENCFVIAVVAKRQATITDGNHIVLVNPSNAGNLGTIMRSALGFGIENIAVITPAVDPFDPKTVRASMGAAARVRVELFESFDDYRRRFPNNNFYPFMLDGSSKMQHTPIEENFSLILGNEATGLPREFSEIGQPIRIEHTHNIDSLNLPIAASIAMYEATRNNW
ncbi:MAG: TrmH family RNA methyltransferase [Clostridia bacterium]|nr:TrmH family RNA methyltransferase [Clostridia bacterium]